MAGARWAARVLAALFGIGLLLGQPSAARAQSHLQFELSPCLESALDGASLRRRVSLELGPGWQLAEEGDESARAVLRIESPCATPTPQLTLGLVAEGLRLERRVVLGELQESGALWALAVLVTDLLDRLQQPPDEPEPTSEPSTGEPSTGEPSTSEPSTESSPELAPEPPVIQPRPEPELLPIVEPHPAPGPAAIVTPEIAGPVGFARTSFGVAVVTQLHVLVPTGMAGLALFVSHDWLRVSLSGLGTEVPTSLGSIAIGSWRLAVDVAPLSLEHGNLRIRWQLGAKGGVGYAAGRVRNPTLFGAETLLASLCARTSVIGALAVERDLTLELGLHVGFDFLGADLRSGTQVSATTYGPTIGLSFGASSPL